MQEERDRHALLRLALGNDRVYGQIDFTGAAEPFTLNMIDILVQRGEITRGKQALWALLEVVTERVGFDQQQRITALQPTIAGLSRRPRLLSRKHLPVITKALFGSAKPLPLILFGALFVVLAFIVVRGSPLVTEAYAQNAPYCLPDRMCVVVAQFEPEGDPAAVRFTDEIYSELEKVLDTTAPERFTLNRISLVDKVSSNETPQ